MFDFDLSDLLNLEDLTEAAEEAVPTPNGALAYGTLVLGAVALGAGAVIAGAELAERARR